MCASLVLCFGISNAHTLPTAGRGSKAQILTHVPPQTWSYGWMCNQDQVQAPCLHPAHCLLATQCGRVAFRSVPILSWAAFCNPPSPCHMLGGGEHEGKERWASLLVCSLATCAPAAKITLSCQNFRAPFASVADMHMSVVGVHLSPLLLT